MSTEGIPPDQYEIAITKQNFDGNYNVHSIIVILSIALSLYSSLEMYLIIMTIFKKWKGLYFWSLLICNTGVFWYSIGMMVMYFEMWPLLLSKIVLDIGWIVMVAFQSIVLYSRLGLIVENVKVIKSVKWMIICVTTSLMIPVIIFDFGTSYGKGPIWATGYFYIEQVQVTGFVIQESVISAIYVWKTIHILRIIQKSYARTMVWQLLGINLIIIGLDLMIIILQFKHLQLYQESTKSFVYAVKLKLEVSILSKLVDLVHGDKAQRSMTLELIDSNPTVPPAKDDIQQALANQERPDGAFSNNEKIDPFQSASTESRSSKSGSKSPKEKDDDDGDGICRVISHPIHGVRSNVKESDFDYADFMRTLSKS